MLDMRGRFVIYEDSPGVLRHVKKEGQTVVKKFPEVHFRFITRFTCNIITFLFHISLGTHDLHMSVGLYYVSLNEELKESPIQLLETT